MLKLYVAARILDQSPKLYADMMSNPYGKGTIKVFLDTLVEPKKAALDKERFITYFEEASDYFSPEMKKKATMVTDEVIRLMAEYVLDGESD